MMMIMMLLALLMGMMSGMMGQQGMGQRGCGCASQRPRMCLGVATF